MDASLAAQGWRLSEDGQETLKEAGGNVSKMLDINLKLIGSPVFPSNIKTSKEEKVAVDQKIPFTAIFQLLATFRSQFLQLEGPMVLQITKITNVSAPSYNQESEHAPRLLSATLSDGHITCTALEMCPIPVLSMDTKPGTKVQLNGVVHVRNGFILLQDPAQLKVLGGNVESLVEKWQINRSMAALLRAEIADKDDPPPPFVQFKVANSGDTRGKQKPQLDSQQQKQTADAKPKQPADKRQKQPREGTQSKASPSGVQHERSIPTDKETQPRGPKSNGVSKGKHAAAQPNKEERKGRNTDVSKGKDAKQKHYQAPNNSNPTRNHQNLSQSPWSCPACTLINKDQYLACEACGNVRPTKATQDHLAADMAALRLDNANSRQRQQRDRNPRNIASTSETVDQPLSNIYTPPKDNGIHQPERGPTPQTNTRRADNSKPRDASRGNQPVDKTKKPQPPPQERARLNTTPRATANTAPASLTDTIDNRPAPRLRKPPTDDIQIYRPPRARGADAAANTNDSK